MTDTAQRHDWHVSNVLFVNYPTFDFNNNTQKVCLRNHFVFCAAPRPPIINNIFFKIMVHYKNKWFMVFRFYSKVLSKCRKCHLRYPKFKIYLAENPPGPPYICHHFVAAQMFLSHRGPHSRSAATDMRNETTKLKWIQLEVWCWTSHKVYCSITFRNNILFNMNSFISFTWTSHLPK